jgi:serine protease Do
MPTPQGTGFFIDGSGLFLTALHIVGNVNVPEIWLMQRYILEEPPAMLQRPDMVQSWPEHDIAVLKLDFESNAAAPQLNDLNEFPYITVDLESQEDGTPIYSFGYPLPEVQEETLPGGLAVVHPGLGPRTTSAIIASSIEHTKMIHTGADSQVYVLDKALNYGNSGGPVVNTETGKAFAICSRFQPAWFYQSDDPDDVISIPSLYGVATSIANIADFLRQELHY